MATAALGGAGRFHGGGDDRARLGTKVFLPWKFSNTQRLISVEGGLAFALLSLLWGREVSQDPERRQRREAGGGGCPLCAKLSAWEFQVQ